MIRLTECNEITCSDGAVLNDKLASTTCTMGKKLQVEFPYEIDYQSPDYDEVLTLRGFTIQVEHFPIVDGERASREVAIIEPLADTSKFSKRVQKFVEICFDKQAFIASLPRVQNAVKGERVRMHKKIHEDGEYVEIVQVEEEITDDGELIPAHPEEVRYDLVPVTLDGAVVMEEYDTEEVETFIVYKDKLYPEDWNGDI